MTIPSKHSWGALLEGTRALTLFKGAYGLSTRVSQGLLLLVAVLLLPPRAQSDIALALALVSVANLISNLGIPTLLVRVWGEDGDHPSESARRLIRWYVLLTISGTPAVFFISRALFAEEEMALGASLLFAAISVLTGVEYFALAADRYRDFLRGPALAHASISYVGPLLALVTRSGFWGLLGLAVSAVLPLAVGWGRKGTVLILRSMTRRLAVPAEHLAGRAARVFAGTAGASLLYGIDVMILRGAGLIGEDARYRLAVLFVGVVVGLTPMGFFALRESVRNQSVDPWAWAVFGIFASVSCLFAGAVAMFLGGPIGTAGSLLVWMGPLASLRVGTQYLVGLRQGAGFHSLVAAGFWVAVACFVVLGAVAVHTWGPRGLLASQTLVEGGLFAALFIGKRRRLGTRRLSEEALN